jgi:hypothetical protein
MRHLTFQRSNGCAQPFRHRFMAAGLVLFHQRIHCVPGCIQGDEMAWEGPRAMLEWHERHEGAFATRVAPLRITKVYACRRIKKNQFRFLYACGLAVSALLKKP